MHANVYVARTSKEIHETPVMEMCFSCISLSVFVDSSERRSREFGPEDASKRRASEGEIVWYTTMSSDQSNEFMARFQQKYPFLKPSVIPAGRQRAAQPHRHRKSKAGKYLFDVAHGTGRNCFAADGYGTCSRPTFRPERKMIPDDLKDKNASGLRSTSIRSCSGYNTAI